MNSSVYKLYVKTYLCQPLYLVSIFGELVRSVLLRVVTLWLLAQMTASLAVGDFASAKMYVLYYFAAYLSGAVIGNAADILGVSVENNKYVALSKVWYRKLVGKDMSFYRDNQTGYLTGLYRQYLDSMMMFTRLLRLEVPRTIIAVAIPAMVLLLSDTTLGLIAISMVVLQIIYMLWASSKSHRYRLLSHEIYRKVTGEVSDVITNIVAFKSGNNQITTQHIEKLAHEENDAFMKRHVTNILLDLPRVFITAIGATALFWVILSSDTMNNAEAIGLSVFVVTYIFNIVYVLSDLPNLIMRHDDLVTKIYPAIAYHDNSTIRVADPEHPQPLPKLAGAIDIKDVDFSYRSTAGVEMAVFNKLSISIPAGQRVGVVGLSGAGKSTLTSLLMRFDDVDAGSICVDGIDIRTVAQADLRNHLSYVPQEPLLFHRTIRENIAYFKPDATEAEIIRAAEAAHAHEFIGHLAEGYDSFVGERGIKLSGGQKQRIVIARAILKNAPIMIFDEATSALDSESERIIQQALPEIIGSHTAIVIAHRLSTVAGLDRILVMHDGAIEEDGTHDELLAKKGRYWSLWQKQTNGATK